MSIETIDELAFFDKNPEALPLYHCFKERLSAELGPVKMRVQKTQITFSNKHVFACVSFIPVRKAAKQPKTYIVITLGLEHRLESPRVDVAVEPYPNRWTHHILISTPEEIDDELFLWVKEAAAFSANK